MNLRPHGIMERIRSITSVTFLVILTLIITMFTFSSAEEECRFETKSREWNICGPSDTCLRGYFREETAFREVTTYRGMRTPWWCPLCAPRCTVIGTSEGPWLFQSCCGGYAKDDYSTDLEVEVYVTIDKGGNTLILTSHIPTCAQM